jgi:hypothetical protein
LLNLRLLTKPANPGQQEVGEIAHTLVISALLVGLTGIPTF